jgi:hypothetical protein
MFTVATEIPPPAFLTALFSDDGLTVLVTFSSATNQPQGSSPFPCSQLLSFPGDHTSSCRWLSTQQLVISPAGTTRVVVNNTISLLSNTLQAPCQTKCSNKFSPSHSISISPPTFHLMPTVVLSFPSVIGPCDSLTVDISASTGSAGRIWQSYRFEVTGDDPNTVSFLQSFFHRNFSVTSPVSIPARRLTSGNYLIGVTLCNFLGFCSFRQKSFEALTRKVVTLMSPGSSERTLTTQSELTISTTAFVSLCSGLLSNASLSYSWVVLKEKQTQNITNISRDPSKFRLKPFTLLPGLSYEIQVSVSSRIALASSLSIYVLVKRSNVVAALSNPAKSSVRQGDSLLIDGSGSYDPDLSPADQKLGNLRYDWTCSQSEPALGTTCGFDIVTHQTAITVTPKLTTSIGEVYMVTLTVTDGSRRDQRSISVIIAQARDPLLSASIFPSDARFNPSQSILIKATISTTVPGLARWNLVNSNSSLSSIVSTNLMKQLRVGNNLFNLMINPNTLLPAIGTYSFSLKVDGFTSLLTISVNVNSPPALGSFLVTPTTGTELTTSFTFSAPQWVDQDLPISYEFSFTISYLTSSAKSLIRGRSESTFTSSYLPSGLVSNNHRLLVRAALFDSLNAETSSTLLVTVTSLGASAEDLHALISSQLSNKGDVDVTKQALSLTSAVLNSRNCDGSPNCGTLNRFGCEKTAFTCGPCLEGFLGQSGDGNSRCSTEEEYWEMVNHSNASTSVKICVGNCSNHGLCKTISTKSGVVLDRSCPLYDSGCQVQCFCSLGWNGNNCDLSDDEMDSKKGLREDMLVNLFDLIDQDEPTADGVTSWISTLGSLAQAPEELSENSVVSSLDIVDTILNAEATQSLPLESYRLLLDTLDSANQAMAMFSSPSSSRRILLSSDSSPSIFSPLDAYSQQILDGMFEGQSEISDIKTSFRLLCQLIDLNVSSTLFSPQTEMEMLLGAAPSSVQLISNSSSDQSASFPLALSEIQPQSYGDLQETNLTSNLLRLMMSPNASATTSRIIVVLQNLVSHPYFETASSRFLNVTCLKNVISHHSLFCEDNGFDSYGREILSGVDPRGTELTIDCDGTPSLQSKQCPAVRFQPRCQLLSSASPYVCHVLHFNADTTTCSCESDPSRRSLSDFIGSSVVLDVATVSEVVVDEFVATVLTSDELSSSSLKEGITIILMYGVFWAIGLAGLIGCAYRQRRSESRKLGLDRKTPSHAPRSKDEIRQNLTSYINELFPSVFQSQPYLSRLFREISKHHRYLILFTASGGEGASSSSHNLITGIHLLTVQSMLMFMLAVFYDLQVCHLSFLPILTCLFSVPF